MARAVPKAGLRMAVESRVKRISQILSSHAGGVELDTLGERGEVVLRFTGMCAGCQLKPVTMASLIIPALLDIQGVSSVEAPGAVVSMEARKRLGSYLNQYASTLILDRLKE
jgi:Fe-S cluster biogenesis protein NfuA